MNAFNPSTERYVSLATYRKNGAEVRTPVWVAELEGRYYVFSAANAGKVKRLRNNHQVRIAACNYSGNLLHSDWLAGNAKLVTDAELIERVYAAFTNKYGWQVRLTNLLSKLSGRYHQRSMIEIEPVLTAR